MRSRRLDEVGVGVEAGVEEGDGDAAAAVLVEGARGARGVGRIAAPGVSTAALRGSAGTASAAWKRRAQSRHRPRPACQPGVFAITRPTRSGSRASDGTRSDARHVAAAERALERRRAVVAGRGLARRAQVGGHGEGGSIIALRREVAPMLRTGNPALKETTFRGLPRAVAGEAMTLQGTVNKTGISLCSS